MNLAELNKVAEAMVAPGRGILAADESSGTIKKRFDAIGAESTEDSRRDYREMLFRSTDAMSKYISGVILYDETIRQKAKDGTPLVELIKKAGSHCPASRSTRAPSRCRSARARSSPRGSTGCASGCRIPRAGRAFAKWRAVIDIGAGIPSYTCITPTRTRWRAMPRSARTSSIVPIVEPEVLMDGDHDIDRCYEVTEWVLKDAVRGALLSARRARRHGAQAQHGDLRQEGAKRAGVEEVAEKTVKLLKACVPGAVPGIAFLSGGQSDEEATAHLDAMNRIGDLPWRAHLLLRPRAAGSAAEGLGGQVRERRGGAARVHAPRAR